MSGFEKHLGLFLCEDPIGYTGWYRGAHRVSDGGGETPVVVSGVLGDVDVSSTADILRHGWRCEPIVCGGLYVRGYVGILRGGGEGLYGVPRGRDLIARVRHDQY